VKIIFFRAGKNKNKDLKSNKNKFKMFFSNKKVKYGLEKAFTLSILLIFTLLVAFQIMLATPSTRQYMVLDSEYEGRPLRAEESLFNEGELELELQNMESDEGINVLVNGDAQAVFSTKNMYLKVREGDVVEIDGTQSANEALVRIVNSSENLKKQCLGKQVEVQADIKSLIQIKME